jgi:hypothetical protein
MVMITSQTVFALSPECYVFRFYIIEMFFCLDNSRQMTKTWWETPMGGCVLSFLKAE